MVLPRLLGVLLIHDITDFYELWQGSSWSWRRRRRRRLQVQVSACVLTHHQLPVRTRRWRPAPPPRAFGLQPALATTLRGKLLVFSFPQEITWRCSCAHMTVRAMAGEINEGTERKLLYNSLLSLCHFIVFFFSCVCFSFLKKTTTCWMRGRFFWLKSRLRTFGVHGDLTGVAPP